MSKETPPHLPAIAALPSPVLIVENELRTRTRIENILVQHGYERKHLLLADSLAQASDQLAQHEVGLALVDLGLPDGSGLEVIAQLREAYADIGILVISAWNSGEAILNALRAGASGYVLKERDDLEVSLAIRSILRGGTPIDPFLARRIIDELYPATIRAAEAVEPTEPVEAAKQPDHVLSARELQILQFVAEGLVNREIAECLCLSPATIASHVRNIYRKLAVTSRIRAVQTARVRGLLSE
ncbi:MAG: response regulator transcription factor [Comamonas sp.]